MKRISFFFVAKNRAAWLVDNFFRRNEKKFNYFQVNRWSELLVIPRGIMYLSYVHVVLQFSIVLVGRNI